MQLKYPKLSATNLDLAVLPPTRFTLTNYLVSQKNSRRLSFYGVIEILAFVIVYLFPVAFVTWAYMVRISQSSGADVLTLVTAAISLVLIIDGLNSTKFLVRGDAFDAIDEYSVGKSRRTFFDQS